MIGQLVDILCEDESIQLAKIVGINASTATCDVVFMIPLKKKHNGERVFGYEENIDTINTSNISGYYDSDNEKVAGFNFIDGVGFTRISADSDDDSDFETESEFDSEDESLIDSDEEDEE